MERRHATTKIPLGGRRRTDVPFVFTKDEWEDHQKSDTAQFNQLHITLKKISDAQDEHYAADTIWKNENQPALDNMRNITGFGKFGLSAVVTFASLLTAFEVIRSFFHKP